MSVSPGGEFCKREVRCRVYLRLPLNFFENRGRERERREREERERERERERKYLAKKTNRKVGIAYAAA